MDGQTIDSVATALRQAREHQGISAQDAAQALNVPLHYLQALEGGPHPLADPVYLIPFLRTYVAYLGLDPDAAVRQFIAELHQSTVVTIKKPSDSPLSPARFSAWIVPLVLLVGGLIGLSFAVQSLDLSTRWAEEEEPVRNSVTAEQEQAATAPGEDRHAASPPVTGQGQGAEILQIPESALPSTLPALALSAPSLQASQIPHVPSGLRQLHIRAVEKTWLHIVIDEDLTQEVLLQPNEQIRWQARNHFILTVGNAGGIELAFDGTPLPALGRSGEVVRRLRLPALEAQ